MESRNFVAKLAPEPASPGLLRSYPLEPFTLEWSWSQLVPKLVRIAAISLVIAGIWLGIPRLYKLASAIFETRTAVVETRSKADDTNAKLDQVLLRISQKEGVPLEALRAILAAMGTVATTADQAEISRLLTAKAAEFNALTERLNQLSNADPEVARLRLAAAVPRSEASSPRPIPAWQGPRRATLRVSATSRLSPGRSGCPLRRRGRSGPQPPCCAQTRTPISKPRRITPRPRVAKVADPKIALRYTIDRGQSLMALGTDFGRNEALQQAIDLFRTTQEQLFRRPIRMTRHGCEPILALRSWSLARGRAAPRD